MAILNETGKTNTPSLILNFKLRLENFVLNYLVILTETKPVIVVSTLYEPPKLSSSITTEASI